MKLLLAGISHRTASLDLRERLTIAPSRLADANRALLRLPGVREVIILSTCARTELTVCYDAEVPDLSKFLAGFLDVPPTESRDRTYEYYGIDAVQHVPGLRKVLQLD